MTKQQDVFNTIKALVGQANILTIPRAFVTYTGDLNSALLLSQLLYWYDRTGDPDHVLYKTYHEWQVELGLTKYQVTRAAGILKDKGILETFVRKAEGSPTVHYRLNAEAFAEQFTQLANYGKSRNLTIESEETRRTYTKTTTETTPSTTAAAGEPPEIGEYVRVYEQNVGQATPIIFDALVELAGQYSLLWFTQAVGEACASNARNFKYIAAILDRWRSEGFKTPKPVRPNVRLTFKEKGDGTHKHGTARRTTDAERAASLD